MFRKFHKIFIISLILWGLHSIALADLTQRINTILNRPSQQNVEYGIIIKNAATGKTLYTHNAHRPMIPASNMKLITTATALRILGPDFKYETRIGLCEKSVIIKGSGDPLLGDPIIARQNDRTPQWILENIAKKLKSRNVTQIEDIIIDTTIFDDIRVHPSWPTDQLNKWYAAEVSGVNYRNNCIDMTVTNVNGRAVVTIEPNTDFITIDNEVDIVSGSAVGVGAYRIPGEMNHLKVKGRCRNKQGPFRVAIERPGAFMGYVLSETLLRENIATQGNLIVGPAQHSENFDQLTRYVTPLSVVLARCNKDSLGLAAESLFKTIATSKNNWENGSWQTGRNVIHRYLLSLGANENDFYVDDGSGLSRENRLSPSVIAKVLQNIYNSKNWEYFKESLAIGGIDGTISRYFYREKYKGKIRGKTGYIAGVKSFSGIAQTPTGEFIFSIITNNANGTTRRTINDITKAIFE